MVWVGNPLFMLFRRDEPQETNTDVYEENFIYAIRLSILDAENEVTTSPNYVKRRGKMDAFLDLTFEEQFGDILPILLITYVFSVSIAFDFDLRSQFYAHYHGKVPAIFQFLLNSIRIGGLNDFYVYNLEVDHLYQDLPQFLGYTNMLMLEELKGQSGIRYLLVWFYLLEHQFANHNILFRQFVELERTPVVSNGPLTLTGVNCINPNFLTSYVVQNSGLKHKYQLLNKCLNTHIVVQDYHEKEEALEASLNAQASQVIDAEEEKKLASSLIDFVIHCSVSDLKELRSDSRVTQPDSQANLSKASPLATIGTFNYLTVGLLVFNLGFIGFELYKYFH